MSTPLLSSFLSLRLSVLVVVLLLISSTNTRALNNGLARTPQMGWNSWDHFFCDIDETLIRSTADTLVSTGLAAAGYRYVNLDDCWQTDRASDGTIIADPVRFPSGIAALAAYVHSLGLLFGLYSDAGQATCQGRPGGMNYEKIDAATYAAWGVDYLKYDNCNDDGVDPKERYPRMRDALNATGHHILFSLCEWGVEDPATWAPEVGNSWRTTGDITDTWTSFLTNLDGNARWYPQAGPGGWNDPDMLEVGNGGMSHDEYVAHFSLWALMKSPMLIGCDITHMSNDTLSILTNRELIAVNQDALGVQGHRVWDASGLEVWAGPLANGDVVIVLHNRSPAAANITARWADVGVPAGTKVSARDLWSKADLGSFTDSLSLPVPMHGARALRLSASHVPSPATRTVRVYDLRYTVKLPLLAAYEEQQFVAALGGLWNRHEPNLVVRLQPADQVWLDRLTAPGQWLAGAEIDVVPTLDALVEAFRPIGVVLWDTTVPSTSLLASTIAGSDGFLPVAYRPDDPASLYSRLVANGPRLPVGLSLVGRFNDSGPLHSAKAEAYAWMLRRQLLAPGGPLSDGAVLGFFVDAWPALHEPHMSDPSAYDKITVVNHDHVVQHAGVFFDLAIWDDEAPVDDPHQPLGTDLSTLHALLRAAWDGAGQRMTIIEGFTPWAFKYVGAFSAHGHGGVAAEWATARVTSSYDALLDADACCVGTMASASFWSHHPLLDRFVQRPPPSRASLLTSGLLNADGSVPPLLFYMLYSGDFDSSAWLYNELLQRWDDPARGTVPIAWPVDPELALRFPPIFPALYAQATAMDVLVSGDSGAGYLNPTQLHGAARANVSGLPDGRPRWSAWNAAWYRQMGLTSSGFVITGDAPQMSAEDEADYAAYSANGLVLQGFPGVHQHLTANMPVTGQTDLPSDATQAAAVLASYLPPPSSSSLQPRFWMFRSVLTSPTFLRNVQRAATTATNSRAVAVDALTLGYLMRAAMGGTNDHRVAYTGDSIPAAAAAGTALRFNVSVRNDGWNVLHARSHSLLLTVDEVHILRATPPRPTRAIPTDAHTTSARLTAAMAERFPSNPAVARAMMKRLGLEVIDVLPLKGMVMSFTAAFPGDLALSAELSVPAKVALPSRAALRRGCARCFGGVDEGNVVAVVFLSYEVQAVNGDGTATPFSAFGNIPWRSAVWLRLPP